MNKRPLSIILLLLLSLCGYSQSVEDLMNTVSNPNLQQTVAVLSGEQAAMINGSTQTISSRVHTSNDLAADYIKESLEAFPNLDVQFQNFNFTGKNIIATQIGQTNPDDIYLVCAHYDSVTTFCADDNATGVAAVIEIARILSTQCTDNTIVYALWDEEEIGLRGAAFYAQEAADTSGGNTRDNILAVINMDMIGYDGDAPGTAGDNEFDIDVRNIANSIGIKDDLISILNTYTFDLSEIVVNPGTTASDHSRFWNQGYSAVLVGESWETNDQTPDYHTSNDRIEDIDFQYMTELTKLVTAYMASKSGLLNIDNTVTQSSSELISNQATGTYQWIDCDTNTAIPGETSQSFAPLTSGNYAVEVTIGGCTEMSTCTNFTVLSSEEFQYKEIIVFPNPVVSTVKIDNALEYDLNISISDITGKIVRRAQSQNELIEIEFNDMASGVYFVTVASDTKSSTFKIIKE